MAEIFGIIASAVEGASLIFALVLMVSLFLRKNRSARFKSLLMGGLFSFAVFITMADPIDMGSYGVYDLRALFIAGAAALIGPISGIVTAVVGLLLRWSIGGPGMVPGFVSIVCALLGGFVWWFVMRKKVLNRFAQPLVLGVLISTHVFGIFAFPSDMWLTLAANIVPIYLIVNTVGAALMIYLIGGEVSFLSEAEATLDRANTDHLTGILNRRGLEKEYPDAPEDAGYRGRALLYFDIDFFKAVNDTHGHAVGDDALLYISKRVSQNIRPNDVFARIGGDEFIVVLDDIEQSEAERIAQRCRSVVEDGPFAIDSVVLPITISVGGVWVVAASPLDLMLEAADSALYKAKEAGRNIVEFQTYCAQSDGFVSGKFACDHAPYCAKATRRLVS